MQAKDVMSRDILTVTPADTVLHAARLMLQHKISGLPVVDGAGNLVGLVTEGDLLRRAETATVRRRPRWLEFLRGPGAVADEYTHAAGRFVSEVMTHAVITATPEMELQEVVGLMEQHHIKRLPVVTSSRLVGIVTRQNLLRALIMQSDTRVHVSAESDVAVRDRIRAELKAQSWAPTIEVSVTNGRVKLEGTILDERLRGAIRVVVENVAGVKGIDDHLVWIEPMSGMVIGPQAA